MSYKVAIVGGGTCGLYLAWKLSLLGHSVTVFEKKERIGKEACSGLFSERILDFVPGSEDLIKNRISRTLINFPRKRVEVKFGKEMFVINHWELDRLLAGLAKKSGAKITLNRAVTSFPLGFDRIIGCDGAGSFIRKGLNLKNPNLRLGILGFIPQKDTSSFVETWAVKNGFIWKVPRGEETEYGIMASLSEAKILLDGFLRRRNITIERVKSALIPQSLIIPFNDSITLCGDAAGLTKPWSGGGVIWSLTSANILLKNFPNFIKYKKEVKSVFLKKIIISKIITRSVYLLGFKAPWLLPKSKKIESDFLL